MPHDPRADDICPRIDPPPVTPTVPVAPPIYTTAVWRCESPDQADALLSGALPGYVYSRDGHPNADLLAEKFRELHAAERACICSSGMAALALPVLAHLRTGDHVVASNQLYGRSLVLLGPELSRLGIDVAAVDTCDLAAVRAALRPNTRLLVVETISNPLLRVADLASLAQLAREAGARLLVDNTFASPVVCRPLELGADLVYESLTKIASGHSDVLLGALCGPAADWDRVVQCLRTWGMTAGPFDCWLAARGLGTLALRVERANANALAAARFLAGRTDVAQVHYPSLAQHPDHALAARQFGERCGAMVTFELPGGAEAAARFIRAAKRIPFSPSLGDLATTLSHPQSTSHRGLTEEARQRLGISGGAIRLSVGIESPEAVLEALEEGLQGLTAS
jgi:cystathionine beta-lyase/cystathionine gamma-synthase